MNQSGDSTSDISYFSGLVVYLKGIAMGISDLIPGVSGGTMALILGIYRRLISAIDRLDYELVRGLLVLITNPFDPHNRSRGMSLLRRVDYLFLGLLLAGILSALAVGVNFLPPLIEAYTAQVQAVFLGIILISTWIPLREAYKSTRAWTPRMIGLILVGLLLGGGLAFVPGMNSVTRNWVEVEVEPGQLNQVLRDRPYAGTRQQIMASPKNKNFSPASEETEVLYLPVVPWWLVPVLGGISVSALVLPGISGAYILVILGGYIYLLQSGETLVRGIMEGTIPLRSVGVVALFGVGAVVGVKLLCRGLTVCLEQFPGQVFSFLAGLMAGALPALWPYKANGIPYWPGWEVVRVEVVPWILLAMVVTVGLIWIWEIRSGPVEELRG